MNYYCHFPTRNGAETLQATLNSLFAQTLQPEKVIVVNDGSTDITRDILQSYDIEIIDTHSREIDFNRIPSLQNMCLQKGYDYELILSDDIIIPSNYAELLIERMEANKRTALSSGAYEGDRNTVDPNGAGRMVSCEFWYEYCKKYPYRTGWEAWPTWLAWYKGFETHRYLDIIIKHIQPLGRGHRFKTFVPSMKALGYNPQYVYARVINNLIHGKEIPRKASLQMLVDYWTFQMNNGNPYYTYYDDGLRKFVHDKQKGIVVSYLARNALTLLDNTLFHVMPSSRPVLRNLYHRVRN